MSNADMIYTEIAAGKYLGGSESPISRRTLQRWRLEGFGPIYIKLGRLVRYRQSDLDAFIQDGCQSSTSSQLVPGGVQ